MSSYWQLKIVEKNGTITNICGDEDVMRTAQREWKDGLAQIEVERPNFIEVHGVCDSVDRAEATFVIDFYQITSMGVTKLY